MSITKKGIKQVPEINIISLKKYTYTVFKIFIYFKWATWKNFDRITDEEKKEEKEKEGKIKIQYHRYRIELDFPLYRQVC